MNKALACLVLLTGLARRPLATIRRTVDNVTPRRRRKEARWARRGLTSVFDI